MTSRTPAAPPPTHDPRLAVAWIEGTGYPAGSVVAMLPSRLDAEMTAASLVEIGVPGESIELVDSTGYGGVGGPVAWILVVRRPRSDTLTDIRRVLRGARVDRARRYRPAAVEEIVRLAARRSALA